MADIMPPAAPSAQPPTSLLATRDALVNALVGKTIGAMGRVGRLTAEEIADALAGVVRDPATLADDETLVDAAMRGAWSGDPHKSDRVLVQQALRALVAALTEDPS